MGYFKQNTRLGWVGIRFSDFHSNSFTWIHATPKTFHGHQKPNNNYKKAFLSHSCDQRNKTAKSFHQNLIRTNNHTKQRKWHTQRQRSKTDGKNARPPPSIDWSMKPKKGVSSLVVQWLGLSAPTAGGLESIPGRGTKIPHAMQEGRAVRSKATGSSKGQCSNDSGFPRINGYHWWLLNRKMIRSNVLEKSLVCLN